MDKSTNDQHVIVRNGDMIGFRCTEKCCLCFIFGLIVIIIFVISIVETKDNAESISPEFVCNVTNTSSVETDEVLFYGYEISVLPNNRNLDEFTTYRSFTFLKDDEETKEKYDNLVKTYHLGYKGGCYEDEQGYWTFNKKESSQYMYQGDITADLTLGLSLFIFFFVISLLVLCTYQKSYEEARNDVIRMQKRKCIC